MLVLSLFPGIGLLDRAFEDEGFTVVRGPDLIWGGDIKTFHALPGRFDGVIGGVPCQRWSALVHMVRQTWGEDAISENMFPEYERVVAEAQPTWFLSECAPAAPRPVVPGFVVTDILLDNRWLGDPQSRKRRFCFGTRDGRKLAPEVAIFESPVVWPTVTGGARECPIALGGSGKPKPARRRPEDRALSAGPRMSVAEMLERQGFPPTMLDDCPLTEMGKRQAIGNGVPRRMGAVIAQAVKRALTESRAA